MYNPFLLVMCRIHVHDICQAVKQSMVQEHQLHGSGSSSSSSSTPNSSNTGASTIINTASSNQTNTPSSTATKVVYFNLVDNEPASREEVSKMYLFK
jgi:hypothetical protein